METGIHCNYLVVLISVSVIHSADVSPDPHIGGLETGSCCLIAVVNGGIGIHDVSLFQFRLYPQHFLHVPLGPFVLLVDYEGLNLPVRGEWLHKLIETFIGLVQQ